MVVDLLSLLWHLLGELLLHLCHIHDGCHLRLDGHLVHDSPGSDSLPYTPIRMTSRHPLGEFQVVCPQGFLGSFFLMGVAMMFSFLVMSLLLGYILVNLDFTYLEIF